MTATSIDPQWYRQVLGQYPTGVCVLTARHPTDGPVGMVVGSFTSVSLDPPLIGFFPDRKSTSWPKIRDIGRFCVNILGAHQEALCRQLASKRPDKFAGVPHRPDGSDSVVIEGVVAWISCDIASVEYAGDHFLVLGAVRELHIANPSLPLLFFRGGYGSFHPQSLVAPDITGALSGHLRTVDLIRPMMERLAQTLDCTCIATARTGTDVTILASSTSVPADQRSSTLVGARLPFLPPTGAVFAAWNGEQEIDDWLRLSADERRRSRLRASLPSVRRRGYSVAMMSPGQRALASAMSELARNPEAASALDLPAVVNDLVYDPDELTETDSDAVRQVSAPIFGPDATVSVALTLYDFGKRSIPLLSELDELLRVTRLATELTGGRPPDPVDADRPP